MPFFSIIIPTYNRAHMLNEVVDSLTRQTFSDWECLIVDDGSTDNTKCVVDALMKKEQRVRYIYQKNSERSIARNNGAKNATGSYFIFLDSDDYFEPDHLFNLQSFIRTKKDAVAMFFTGVKRNDNGKISAVDVIAPEPLPSDYFLFNAVVPARVCLHRDIFKTYAFDPDCIVVEDTVLWTELLEQIPVFFVPVSSVVYNWHDDNSVNLFKNNAFKLRLKGLRKLFYQIPVGKKISSKTKRVQLSQCFMGIAKHHRLNNRMLLSAWYVLIALLLYPQVQTKEKIFHLTLGWFKK